MGTAAARHAILALLLTGMALPATAGAAVLPATCATVADVVAEADGGDEVVLDGLCGDDEDTPAVVISEKSLTLRGDGTGQNGFIGGAEVPHVLVDAMGSPVSVAIEDLVFRDATASAIRLTGCVSLTVQDSTFTGNGSGARGGAINASPGCGVPNLRTLTLIDSTFGGPAAADANTAPQSGGAVFLEAAGNALVVDGSTFRGNVAGRDGGAIAVAGAVQPMATVAGVRIERSTFTANTAGRLAVMTGAVGGAVAVVASADDSLDRTVHVSDSAFTGNRIDDEDDETDLQEGGALAVLRGDTMGAARPQVLLERNRFATNAVEDVGRGGAVSVRGWELDSLRNAYDANTVAGGSSARGGAVHVGPADPGSPVAGAARFYSDIFTANGVAADALGAAVAATGDPSAPTPVGVRQVTFAGNVGPEAAIDAGADTTLDVVNAIVHGTGASTGGEVAGAGTITVSSSNVCATPGVPVAGAGNTCVDPQLTADGHETAASPGIDGGTLAGAALFAEMPGPAQDHDGVARIVGALPDLGADEYSGADLGVTLDAAPSAAETGASIVYTGRIENAGADLASRAVATLDLPAGTTPLDVSTTHGSCTVDGTRVSCALGTLPLFETAVVRARVVAATAGRFEATLSAASDNPDPTPALARAAATVSDPPVPPPVVDNVGAPPPVLPPKPPALKAADVLRLPSTSRCVNRRLLRLPLRVPAGTTLRTVVVRIGTARARTYRGTALRTRRIDLRNLPKGRVRVRITVTLSDGRTVTVVRNYRACATRRR